jgi:hypothetical protein
MDKMQPLARNLKASPSLRVRPGKIFFHRVFNNSVEKFVEKPHLDYGNVKPMNGF